MQRAKVRDAAERWADSPEARGDRAARADVAFWRHQLDNTQRLH
ncbi:MAG: hypothetical protein ACJ72A_23095 [Nocardioidaceae bacterium]